MRRSGQPYFTRVNEIILSRRVSIIFFNPIKPAQNPIFSRRSPFNATHVDLLKFCRVFDLVKIWKSTHYARVLSIYLFLDTLPWSLFFFFHFLSNKDLGEVKRSLANTTKRLNNVSWFEFFSFVNQSRSERKEENGLKMDNWKAIIKFRGLIILRDIPLESLYITIAKYLLS